MTTGNVPAPRALVTGVARGIGRATVSHLLEDGFRVAGTVRDSGSVPTFPEPVSIIRADATSKSETQAAVSFAAEQLRGLDVVVANAGRGAQGTVLDASEEDWIDQVKNKILTVTHLVDAALPYLRESTRPRVIVVGGMTGAAPEIDQGVVSATRAAQMNLVINLANELAPLSICVNSVLLGAILTDRQRSKFEQSNTDDFDEWVSSEVARRNIPFGRFGSADEVSALIAFLASDSAGYITGALIPIAGGMGL